MLNKSYFQIPLLIGIFFFIPGYLKGQTLGEYHHDKIKFVDTSEEYIRKMIHAKVAYEEAYYYRSSNRYDLKRDYFLLAKRFKQNKEAYLKYIQNKFKGKLSNEISIPFCYVSPIDSYIPSCYVMSYTQLLHTLIYNLKFVKSDTTLICSEKK